MPLYFSWRPTTSADIENWKRSTWTYTLRGQGKRPTAPSRKTFWVFGENAEYTAGADIQVGRLLVVFDVRVHGTCIVEVAENQIDFESDDFGGETAHPDQVIVKANELGGYGIGTRIREIIAVSTRIRLATNKEVAWASGRKERDIRGRQEWP